MKSQGGQVKNSQEQVGMVRRVGRNMEGFKCEDSRKWQGFKEIWIQ